MSKGYPMQLKDDTGNTITPPPCPSLGVRFATSAATNYGTSVKLSQAFVFSVHGYNAAAYPIYLRLLNLSSAAPSVAANTTNLIFRLEPNAPFKFEWPVGLMLTAGLCFGFTKNATAVASGPSDLIAANDILAFCLVYA